ncbi:histidine phosphatase family protein [Klebsiella aerogenes]|uniref:histidine phosphatase family protein n=1 Tax=Klebsiella aerogenes TaxID=548 RepID=UPI003B985E26
MGKIILLRHGESEWNQQNRFTGWEERALTMFIEQIDENKVPDLHVLTGTSVLYEMNENRAITARYSLE